MDLGWPCWSVATGSRSSRQRRDGLYAVTPQAVAKVARLLFFYGWNSFVLFKDGTVVTRGEWPLASDRTEVHLDAAIPFGKWCMIGFVGGAV